MFFVKNIKAKEKALFGVDSKNKFTRRIVMETKDIVEILENDGMNEVDEIEYKDGIKVFDFFYTYDDEEIEAAKAFANDSSKEGENDKKWNEEYFLPYLTDLAADNVSDMIDDICDKYDVKGEYVAYELEHDSYEQCEFILVIADKNKEFDIDKVISDLEL